MNKYLLYIVLVCISCKTLDKSKLNVEVKIKNNSSYTLKNILFFDIKYNSILPNNYSDYKKVDINNGYVYLDANKNQFVMQMKNNLSSGRYTYSIDSLNFKNRYIYYTINKD